MAKPVTLRHITAFGDDPTEHVTLFLGDGPDAAQSTLWLSAQVKVDMPPLKSLSLLRIKALNEVRDLIDAETKRLTALYEQADRVRP